MKTLRRYVIRSRKMTVRGRWREGLRAPSVPLVVTFNPKIGPWAEIRPIVAWCWTFVIREALREHGPNAPILKRELPFYELALKLAQYRWRGVAYDWLGRAQVRVLSREHEEKQLPRTWRYGNFKRNENFPTYETRTWAESLIAMVSHELWHLAGDVRSKGVDSEIVAELTTDAALTIWRKEQKS